MLMKILLMFFLFKTDKKYYQQTIKNQFYLLLKIKSDISFVVVIFNLFTVNFYEKSECFLNQINILDIDIIYYIIKSSIFTNFTDASFAYFIVKKNQHFISKYIFFMINKISQNLLKNIFSYFNFF